MQVEAGILEALPYDAGPTDSALDDTYLIQTPFRPIGCFRDTYFEAPSDSVALYPPFVRIVAELRRNNAPNAAPIYFTQDYALDVTPGGNIGRTPAAQNLATSGSGYPTATFNPLDVTYFGTVYKQYGQEYFAPRRLIFYEGSSHTMLTVRNGGSQGFGGAEGTFYAGESINFRGTLDIPVGMNVMMTTDVYAWSACANPGLTAQVVGSPCNYNVWATTSRQLPPTPGPTSDPAPAPAAKATTAFISLAPNPASHTTTVELSSADPLDAIGRVEVLSVSGQTLWQQQMSEGAMRRVDIPLHSLPTGLYMVRVTTATRYHLAKLIVQ